MRFALWVSLLVPISGMVMGLKTGKFLWNCVLTLSCASIVTLTGRGKMMLPLIIALLISVVGDYFMGHKSGKPSWYLFGIAGFLLAHAAFIWYAMGRFAGSPRIYIAGIALIAMLAWYISARVLPRLLYNQPMQIAVSLYALISALSLIAAAGLQGASQFETLLYGVGIFMIVLSDTLIAENDFVGNKECFSYIMPTYYLCHILVAASAVAGMPY